MPLACLADRLDAMSELERKISETVERIRKDQGLRPEAVCAAAGFSRASYYIRMTDGGWRVRELEAVARLLDRPLVDLVSGGSSSAWTPNTAGRHRYLAVAA